MKYKTHADVLTASYYMKCENTLIRTLSQSKSFFSRVLWPQSTETEFNVAIRPQKIISSMLVLIPANK